MNFSIDTHKKRNICFRCPSQEIISGWKELDRRLGKDYSKLALFAVIICIYRKSGASIKY